MAGGLIALFDDIAALAKVAAASVDDIAAGAAKASAKAAGVVIDDAAVTPQYVQGITPKRELPIIKRIAWGSIKNKLFIILPIALLLSEFLPWMLTPLLMLGGTYLCFEGAEKIIGKLRGHAGSKKTPSVIKGEEAENEVVSNAVRTDFILSAEIMVISLNEVADTVFWQRAAILLVVAVVITIGVYGVVALLVKMDDIGLALTKKDSDFSKKFGHGLVNAMPKVMQFITVVGTAAMLWVGGHIIVLGMDELFWSGPYDLIHTLADPVAGVAGIGGFLAWLVDTFISMIIGFIWGSIVVGIVHLLPFGSHGEDEGHEASEPDTTSDQTDSAVS